MKKNINEAEWKVRVDLAAMFRLTHMMGWDDTVWNHITAELLEQIILFLCINLDLFMKKSKPPT